MSVFDIFSKRQKQLHGEIPDVYSYDKFPQALRVQIVHIWRDTLGRDYQDEPRIREAYQFIAEALCREYGLFSLPGAEHHGRRNYLSELANFLLNEQVPEKVLDAVELSFRFIDRFTRTWDFLHRNNASAFADDAIEELNRRFREHGVGYQFASGEIVRVDSELLHAEAVKPALLLLRAPEYAGAQEEFLKAHEHYRHGRAKEALAECLKALESIMKAVCDKRGWNRDPNATSKVLIPVLFDNGLIPTFWSGHFSALRSTLEAGVPTARNRLGGHGQGAEIVEVPDYLVAYVLHMTASAIVFIADADSALP
jgi:hypothetical protein